MPNYQKGKIYTLRYILDNSLIYVGSTVQTLSMRWSEHKKNCVNPIYKKYDYPLYKAIRETGDVSNWYIELYENFPCETKEELNKREGEIIRAIGTLNKQIAGRSTQQYNEDNKEHIQNRRKAYRERNKEQIKEKNKKDYDANKEEITKKVQCECGAVISSCNLKKHQKTGKHQSIMLTKV